jgi:MFS superfamily sulfate permease-like transporter
MVASVSHARPGLSADVVAALSIAGLLLPEAVAYSGVAELPPQAGVIGLFAGLLCYWLVGRSRFAIVSATSSSGAVLASAMLALNASTMAERVVLASVLVVGSGIAFAFAGVLQLGAMSNLIARPVLKGYTFGLALVIAVKQWPTMVNLHAHTSGFFPLLGELSRDFLSWHWVSMWCGLAALAGLFLLEPFRRIPGALVVIIAAILCSGWLAAHGVALTGPIHLALGAPHFSAPQGVHGVGLVEYSAALMFILYAESYGSIRNFALKHNDEVQPNRDLLALGLANIVSGLFNGTPVGAGYSGSSANEAAGARSRWAGLFAAATVLVLVLAFLPWIERIPEPVLAAIVIHAVSKSLRISVFRDYFRWHRDRIVVLVAVLAVILFGVLNGLLIAIAVSVAILLQALTRPRLSVLGRLGEHDFVSVQRFPQAVCVPGMLVLRPEVPLFFANADPLLAQARAEVLKQPQAKLVVLSLEESPDLDSTALESLDEFRAWLAARGAQLRPARLKDSARHALMHANFPQLSGSELDYHSVDDAARGLCVSSHEASAAAPQENQS